MQRRRPAVWHLAPCLSVFALAALALAAPAAAAEPWPEFRGPTGDGHATSRKLPLTWSEQANVRWKTAIPGKAWSSPVVYDNQVWVTNATEDGKRLSAVAVDLETGKVERDVLVFEVEKPQYCIPRNSYASSTPVIEKGRIYVHYGSAGTACIDTTDGKVLWSRQDLPCNHHRGPASSPILFGDLLILTFDGFDQQYVVGLDKHTGKTAWRKDRNIEYGSDNGDTKKSYGTPTVIQVDGKPQLISPSAAAAVAYDPATGDELWRVRCGGFNQSARPILRHGMLYINTEGGFQMLAVKPDGRGDVTGTHVAWKQNKGSAKYPSLAIVDQRILTGSEQGVISCLDALTGKVEWQQRVGDPFVASPLVAGNRVYFFNEKGETLVVEAGPEFKELARNKLDHGFMASPAVAGDALILRTTHDLYRIEAASP